MLKKLRDIRKQLATVKAAKAKIAAAKSSISKAQAELGKVQPVKAPSAAKKADVSKPEKTVDEALAQVEEIKPDEAASPAPKAVEEPAPAVDDANTLTYTVQDGEDITDVSIRWGVTASAIREINNLGENDKLKAGQVLRLPADAQQN